MATTLRTLRVLDQLRKTIAGITDKQVRDLVEAYATAWDEVAGELEAALLELIASARDGKVSRTVVARSTRLQRALASIGAALRELAELTETRIVGDLDAAVRAAGRSEIDLIKASLPEDVDLDGLLVSFENIDDDALAAIIKRTTEQIHAATQPLSTDSVRVLRRELIRGIAVGANPNETARRIMARTQGRFEGGAARAARIARTETLDAMREAARVSDDANKDTLRGWQWVADLSSRTCPACLAMHGTVHKLSEPGPLGHQNCRCARSPVTKSWRDLGFDIDEPKDLLPSAQSFFNSLTRGQQRDMLGAAGLAAYDRGAWPMSAWATRRSTSGWRDSYVVSRPPSASASSDRLAS